MNLPPSWRVASRVWTVGLGRIVGAAASIKTVSRQTPWCWAMRSRTPRVRKLSLVIYQDHAPAEATTATDPMLYDDIDYSDLFANASYLPTEHGGSAH
jgi:hypothetical protein